MEVLMLFANKDPNALRIELNYDLLKSFTHQLNMPFEEVSNEVNLIILRGAKPVSIQTKTVIDTPAEVLEQSVSNLDAVQNIFPPTIQLIDDKLGEFNDTIVVAWIDTDGRKYVKVVLGSADPGLYWIKKNLSSGKTTGSLGPGHHIGVWRLHKSRYEAISLLDDTDASGKIEPEEIDHVTPGRRIVGIDKNGYLLGYGYGVVTGEHIHGGGMPTKDHEDEVFDWSSACFVICGAEDGYHPGSVFESFRGWLEVEGPRKDSKGNLNSQARFNTVVWNAWSLYMYEEKIFGGIIGTFSPVIEFGARDLPEKLADERLPRWVTRMQEKLNSKRSVVNPFIPYLEDRFPDSKEALRFIEELEPDGIFGDKTAKELRSFQLAAYYMIQSSILILDNEKYIGDEILWEYSQWICGPQTWYVLDFA
jgi:peptidoglycan hydrolase-like protein with peptidoglycan-binding domain